MVACRGEPSVSVEVSDCVQHTVHHSKCNEEWHERGRGENRWPASQQLWRPSASAARCGAITAAECS